MAAIERAGMHGIEHLEGADDGPAASSSSRSRPPPMALTRVT